MVVSTILKPCTNANIFLSYASEDVQLATNVAQALKVAGHRVFFAEHDAEPSAPFIERIKSAIWAADRFILLASRHSVAAECFTHTEIRLAEERWPNPAGHVVTIVIDPTLDRSTLPAYLTAVTTGAVGPQDMGDPAADVVYAMERTRRLSQRCWLALLGLPAVVTLGFLAWPQVVGPDVELRPLSTVHFRALADIPKAPAAPDAPTAWTSAPLAVVISPVAYNNRSRFAGPGRVLDERVRVTLGGQSYTYHWKYEVNLTDHCDTLHCRTKDVEPQEVKPVGTLSRETLFTLDPGSPNITWRKFVDTILDDASATVEVSMTASYQYSGLFGPRTVVREASCTVPLAQYRPQFSAKGYGIGKDPRPTFFQHKCQS